MTARSLRLVPLAALLVGAACGGEPTQPDLRVDRVEIAPPVGSVQVQQTLQLSAIAKTAAGDVLLGKAISWSSSNEAFATVSQSGTVTGIADGTVTITAASEQRSAVARITVWSETQPPPPPPPPANPVPAITSLTPSLLVAGTEGARVTVRGEHFIAGTIGLWKSASRPTEVVSATELRIELSADDLAFAGTGRVTVFNPAPGGGSSNALDFTIEIKGPKIRIDHERIDLPRIAEAITVRATIYDEHGRPQPSTSDPTLRPMFIPLDNGTQVEVFDDFRDSVRVRARAIGTFRVLAMTMSGLRDTVTIVVPRGIDEIITSVNAGHGQTCGLDGEQRAYCWGNPYPYHAMFAPIPVEGGERFASLAVGAGRVCGLDGTGAAWCWGSDALLGNSATPVRVPGGLNFVELSGNYQHTCGLTAAGTAWCWGVNYLAQLGTDTELASRDPVPVLGDFTFVTITTGPGHTCAITPAADGTTYCWGSNSHGQAGLDRGGVCDNADTGGPVPCNRYPTAVETELKFTQIAVGGTHTCALTADGQAYCWGYGALGQLGDGAKTSSATPVAVAGGRSFASIDAGIGHTCALDFAGTAWCWGDNSSANNGVEKETSDICIEGRSGFRCNPVPVAVSGGLTFRAGGLTVGGFHTCGMTNDGIAYCWGENSGALGNGSDEPRLAATPQRVWDGAH